jgi:integrase
MSAMRGLTAASGSPQSAYQTRHTFATLALQSGEQIGWVSKQLGHTTDEMVIRHYAKFTPNLTRQDGSTLAKMIR